MPALPPAAPKVIAEAHARASASPGDAQATLHLGMVAQSNGLPGLAIACYERGVRLEQKSFAAHYYLGFALAAQGEFARAAPELREALELRPRSVPVLLKLAEVERELGRSEESARIARELIAADAGNATAHYLLGRATGAAEPFEQALALFPRYGAAQFALAAVYRKANQPERATHLLEDYERDKVAVPPIDDPEGAVLAELASTSAGLLRRAQRADAAGDLATAIALHKQALAADAGLADAWINLISLEARAGNPTGAEEAYRKAVALASGRAEPHYNFGVLCLGLGQKDEARRAFQNAVRADSGHADALVNLGSLAGEQGRLDEAARYFTRAGDSARAKLHLGQIQAFRKEPRARATLEEARALAAKGTDASLRNAIEQELARLVR